MLGLNSSLFLFSVDHRQAPDELPETVDEILDVSEDEGTGWDPYHVRGEVRLDEGGTRGSEHSLQGPLATTPSHQVIRVAAGQNHF